MAKGTTAKDVWSNIPQVDGARPVPTHRREPLNLLQDRRTALSELMDGDRLNLTHHLIDPAKCRMWARHNRDYEALTQERCQDLIDSLLATNEQETAAIVREVTDDPNYSYEVVTGARRHWSITWLRGNGHPDFKFKVQVRPLTDEQAFLISDVENRPREDITDYERGVDYAKAVEFYYNGSQKAMAERMQMAESRLSRLISLARLPSLIADAFPARHQITVYHGEQLSPFINKGPRVIERMEAEASTIIGEREAQAASSKTALPAKDVVKRLIKAAEVSAPKKPKLDLKRSDVQIVQHKGVPTFKVEKARGGVVKFTILTGVELDRPELLKGIFETISRIGDETKFAIDLDIPGRKSSHN